MFSGEGGRFKRGHREWLIGLYTVVCVFLGTCDWALGAGPLPPLQQAVVVTATLRNAVRLTVTVAGVTIQKGNLDLPETSVRLPLPQLLPGKAAWATGSVSGLQVMENVSIEGSDVSGDAYLLPVVLFAEWSGPKARRATMSFHLSGTSWSALRGILAVVSTQPSAGDLHVLTGEGGNSGGATVSVARRQAVRVFIGWFIPREGLDGEPVPLQGECEVTLQVP